MPLFTQCQDPLTRIWTVYLINLASLQIIKMGSVKGPWPALGPPMVCFNGFQQGTPPPCNYYYYYEMFAASIWVVLKLCRSVCSVAISLLCRQDPPSSDCHRTNLSQWVVSMLTSSSKYRTHFKNMVYSHLNGLGEMRLLDLSYTLKEVLLLPKFKITSGSRPLFLPRALVPRLLTLRVTGRQRKRRGPTETYKGLDHRAVTWGIAKHIIQSSNQSVNQCRCWR
jgi:hypothetical protein